MLDREAETLRSCSLRNGGSCRHVKMPIGHIRWGDFSTLPGQPTFRVYMHADGFETLCPMSAGNVIQFARVDFRRDRRTFGIKNEDRFSHVYIIGKTGTGKSTLIETMALQDLERGNGFALVDPHGDLAERIASRIPASRQADAIYFNPSDP